MFDYNTSKWKRLARAIMRRDNYMCQLSKRYGKSVPAEVVHHIYPADEYPEYAYEPWNLIALSRKMHNTLHDRNTDALTAEGIALMTRAKRNIPPRLSITILRPASMARVTLYKSGLKFGKGVLLCS